MSSLVRFVLAGAVAGLAWTASLRAWMAELVGLNSRVDYVGTFAQILLPGVLIGLLLGIAEYFRRTGGRKRWRWLAAAPVLFAIAPQFTPGAFVEFITTGIGGGPIAIALIGILGAFAISGRGPLWGRILAAVPTFLLIVGGVIAPFGFNTSLGLTDPRGVWLALMFPSLMAVYIAACAIPHRPVVTETPLPASA